MASVPTISCTNSGTVIVNPSAAQVLGESRLPLRLGQDGKYTLDAGTSKILDIRFVKGSNVLKVSGTGTITFRWQEGEL